MLNTKTRNIISSVSSILSAHEFKRLISMASNYISAYHREYDIKGLEEYKQKRLTMLFQHAIKTVPFYQTLWNEAGITEIPSNYKKDILSYIPLIDKTQLQACGYKKLISSVSRPSSLSKSSGTTGNPVFRFKDNTNLVYNDLTILRYLRDNCIPIGSTILFTHSNKTTPMSIQPVPLQFLSKRVFASVFELMENSKLAHKMDINVVVGSPHQLQLLAETVFSKSSVKPPKLFVNIAERLDTHQRMSIEKFTGSNVIDVYCGSEFSTLIAFECCQCKKLHTNSDFLIVEILDSENKPVNAGGIGEVVITDLCNYVSPLIRYKTGDLATVSISSSCECKRALPVQLKKIEGRITDQIVLNEGKRISVLPILDDLRALLNRNFTLVQEDVDIFTLQIHELNNEDSNLEVSSVQEILTMKLCVNVSVKIRFDQLSNRISNTSRKVRSFVSRIPRKENLIN